MVHGGSIWLLVFVFWCNLIQHFGKNVILVQLHVYKELYLVAFAGYPTQSINQTKSKTTKIITFSQRKMNNHHELVIILIIIICGLDTINHNFLFSLQNLLVDLVFGCAQINLVRLSRMLRINPALFWHDPCSLLFITRMRYLRKTSVSSIRILLKLVLVCWFYKWWLYLWKYIK